MANTDTVKTTASLDLNRSTAEASRLIEAGDVAAACDLCRHIETAHPSDVGIQSWASQVYQQAGEFDAMLAAARRAAALRPTDLALQSRLVECTIYCGRIDIATEILQGLSRRFAQDPNGLLRVAELYIHCERHAEARDCYARVQRIDPRHLSALYGLAATAVSLGNLDEAQSLFDQVIARSPLDGDAYVNRASLRTWRRDSHHVDQLRAVLRGLPEADPSRIALHYALGKELEDLGEWDAAFESFSQGALRRRQRMAYRVSSDVEVMAHIRKTFTPAVMRQRSAGSPDDRDALFITGLPRSGTTLVDRILSSHSQVASLGEVNTFAFALMRLVGGHGGKQALVQRSAGIHFGRLGELYKAGVRSYGLLGPRLVNKTPLNFLYLGLMALAMPGARLVHLTRHPLDACHAMFKTLFRMGYPFSYSLDDLGQYYLAYHALMAHWRELMPGGFLDIAYERIVSEQQRSTQALLAHCGLDYEPQCLRFHDNRSPTATASAAQVRRPLYANSVGLWKHYKRQLAPLADYLDCHGIDCADDATAPNDTAACASCH